MTSTEKAKELVQKYFDLTDHMNWEQAKECALIIVDEIIGLLLPISAMGVSYWQEVKTEINKL